MAVTGLTQPEFRTISEFPRHHLEVLKGMFVPVLGLCRQAGLAKLGHIAIDGTKIKANASRHKAMTYGRVPAEARLNVEVVVSVAVGGGDGSPRTANAASGAATRSRLGCRRLGKSPAQDPRGQGGCRGGSQGQHCGKN